MNSVDYVLYKTRKSLLEACAELLIQYNPEIEISLKQCSSCNIWLKKLLKDQDGLDICSTCADTYGL